MLPGRGDALYRRQLLDLGLSPAKAARWEEQHAFKPAVIVFNSPERWLQQIPNRLTRLPFVECDQVQQHGGYGDVRFFKIAPEYVVDEAPSRPLSWMANEGTQPKLEHAPEPTVVAVKSFHAREDGLAEAKNMQLLKQGLAGSHSISLHHAIIEHGQGPSSKFLIIFPRAELGDLDQFLRGGSRHGDTADASGSIASLHDPGSQQTDTTHVDLASALLQQCTGLAGALRFLHRGFPVGDKLCRGAHMDLKPANIIIFGGGGGGGGGGVVGCWKFCDFGISVFKEEEDMAGPAEGDSSAVGSVLDYYTQMTMNTRARRGGGQYQSPEVHDSWETSSLESSWYRYVGRSSDIWSFGCIWAEILAFALGGPRYIHEFRVMRRQKINGIFDDCFYSPRLSGSRETDERFVLRPQVHEWLDKHCRPELGSPFWTSCWAAHLIRILRVAPGRRPSAEMLEEYVRHVCTDTLECRQEPGPACAHLEPPRICNPEQQFMDASPELVVPPATTSSSSTASGVSAAAAAAAAAAAFMVPVNYNPLFTGRERILCKIKDFFFHGDRCTQKRLVLTGLGGVGKTQIATAFAYHAYAEQRYTTVLWLFAVDEQELVKCFTQAAKALGLFPEIVREESEDHEAPGGMKPSSIEMPPMAQALLRWLSHDQTSKWLLVFDNADNVESFDVSRFFPKVPWGDILITSRCKQVSRLGHALEIEVMDEDEAVQLLRKCSSQGEATSDDASVRRLAETLGYLPLALDQAGAYVSEQFVDVGEYLELYGERREELLRHKPPRAVWSYEETVFTTWEISYAAASKSDSLSTKLLDLVAFFHSDGVPLALICKLARPLAPGQRLLLKDFVDFVLTRADYAELAGQPSEELLADSFQVRQAIAKLASLSLVDLKKHTVPHISVHPLVHVWLRERHSEAARIKYARAAISLVLHALANAYDTSQFAHAEIVYPYLFICLENVQRIPGLLSDTELHKIGACIIAIDAWVPVSHDHGTLHRADKFYQLVSKRRAGALWQIPDALLAVRRAIRLKSMGRRKECSEHCARYLEHFQQRTRFDRTYASSMARTSAPCFYRVGDYDGAENVYNYVHDSLDSSGAMLARKQLVLGAIKIDRGLPIEAEKVLTECVVELRRGIGQEHFLLRVWHQLMALCYIAQGKLTEAEDTVMEILTGRVEMLDQGKIEFSFSDYELAEVYTRVLREQRRYSKARTFLADLLRKSASARPTPARSLAELSMVLVQLDEATYHMPNNGANDEGFCTEDEGRRRTESLISQAQLIFKEAAAAYELEWNRGTWVFKYFPTTMGMYESRLKKK